MIKNKILFISNNNIGFGLSGGDSIYINFIKYWSDKVNITFLGSQEAIDITPKDVLSKTEVILTDSKNPNTENSLINLFLHYLRRLIKISTVIQKNQKKLLNHQYVYSVSDFLPDLLPAIYLKLKNPKIKWIAGYYLFAPSPFSKDSPYKNLQRIKGFIYWLIQKFTIVLVNNYADYIFITSLPDAIKFKHPHKTIIIQGGVDCNNIVKFLKSNPKFPVNKRKYDACFLGRFHPQKGILGLIDIWKILIKTIPSAKLILIGQGELETEIRKKIISLKLENNITVVGFSTGEKLYKIFLDSKLVVHPATYDSGGMAAAEAMAFGIPGVSYDLESLKTYYPQGMTKTKCFNQKEFAKNIIKLLKDKKIYNTQSLQAKKLI